VSNLVLLNIIVQAPLVIGSVGLWMQARKHRIAPMLGALSEIAWVVWEIYAGLWSVIPWSIFWAALYIRTWLHWEHDAKRADSPPDEEGLRAPDVSRRGQGRIEPEQG